MERDAQGGIRPGTEEGFLEQVGCQLLPLCPVAHLTLQESAALSSASSIAPAATPSLPLSSSGPGPSLQGESKPSAACRPGPQGLPSPCASPPVPEADPRPFRHPSLCPGLLPAWDVTPMGRRPHAAPLRAPIGWILARPGSKVTSSKSCLLPSRSAPLCTRALHARRYLCSRPRHPSVSLWAACPPNP